MCSDVKMRSGGLVYFVDDDASFATSLANALRIVGYEVETFSDVDAFLSEERLENAVLICDMRMPNQSGLDLQAALKQRAIRIPIIFVSGESTVNQAVEAMKNGAKDFLTKPFEPSKLIMLVGATLREHEQRQSSQEALKALSQREQEAFAYIVEGFGNPYIAEKMDIKVSTLKEYKTNIFKKLGVNNVSELIEQYRELG